MIYKTLNHPRDNDKDFRHRSDKNSRAETETMTTITHDMLERKIAAESGEMQSLCSALTLPLSFVDAMIRTLYLLYASRRVVKALDQMEELHCLECDGACGFGFRERVALARDCLTMLLEKENEMQLPFFPRRAFRGVVERLDDKLENYGIAADQDIRDLLGELNEKLDRRSGGK